MVFRVGALQEDVDMTLHQQACDQAQRRRLVRIRGSDREPLINAGEGENTWHIKTAMNIK